MWKKFIFTMLVGLLALNVVNATCMSEGTLTTTQQMCFNTMETTPEEYSEILSTCNADIFAHTSGYETCTEKQLGYQAAMCVIENFPKLADRVQECLDYNSKSIATCDGYPNPKTFCPNGDIVVVGYTSSHCAIHSCVNSADDEDNKCIWSDTIKAENINGNMPKIVFGDAEKIRVNTYWSLSFQDSGYFYTSFDLEIAKYEGTAKDIQDIDCKNADYIYKENSPKSIKLNTNEVLCLHKISTDTYSIIIPTKQDYEENGHSGYLSYKYYYNTKAGVSDFSQCDDEDLDKIIYESDPYTNNNSDETITYNKSLIERITALEKRVSALEKAMTKINDKYPELGLNVAIDWNLIAPTVKNDYINSYNSVKNSITIADDVISIDDSKIRINNSLKNKIEFNNDQIYVIEKDKKYVIPNELIESNIDTETELELTIDNSGNVIVEESEITTKPGFLGLWTNTNKNVLQQVKLPEVKTVIEMTN